MSASPQAAFTTVVLDAQGRVATHRIDWEVVALIGSGAFIGGYLGARFGRRLPPAALRVIIVVIGSVALVKILLFD